MALKFGDAKNLFRRNQGVKFFPGHVIRVHTSINDVDFNKKGNISLAAAPNIVEFVPDNSVASSAEVKTRLQAQPLFRGISDSIASGDLILFTSLGGVNFYIGPINSRNDLSDTSNHIPNHMRYVNPNIPKKSTERLTKKRKPFLDFPNGKIPFGKINPNSIQYVNSQFTDVMIEGRYGNSIRLGSRNINPNIIISNNQKPGFSGEENPFNVGSMIGMLSLGKLSDVLSIPSTLNTFKERWLSYDIMIGQYGNESDALYKGSLLNFNYNYGEFEPNYANQTDGDQIIIMSNKLIFDSTTENMTLSSMKNIQLGSKNFTVNTLDDTIFESRNIYIGKKAQNRSQPMVLGEELRRLLTRILRLIADAQALGDYNVPQPLTVFPNVLEAGSLKAEVDSIMKEFNLGTLIPGQNPESPDPAYQPNLSEGLPVGDRATGNATFFSQHHFIETNRE